MWRSVSGSSRSMVEVMVVSEFVPYFTYRKKLSTGKVREVVCGPVENDYGEYEELVCKIKIDGKDVGFIKMRVNEEGIVVEEENTDLLEEDIIKELKERFGELNLNLKRLL